MLEVHFVNSTYWEGNCTERYPIFIEGGLVCRPLHHYGKKMFCNKKNATFMWVRAFHKRLKNIY